MTRPNDLLPLDPEYNEAELVQRRIASIKEQMNECLYAILQKTDFVHFSEFLSSGKKKNIKKERKQLKKLAEELEEKLETMTFEELQIFSTHKWFSKLTK